MKIQNEKLIEIFFCAEILSRKKLSYLLYIASCLPSWKIYLNILASLRCLMLN